MREREDIADHSGFTMAGAVSEGSLTTNTSVSVHEHAMIINASDLIS